EDTSDRGHADHDRESSAANVDDSRDDHLGIVRPPDGHERVGQTEAIELHHPRRSRRLASTARMISPNVSNTPMPLIATASQAGSGSGFRADSSVSLGSAPGTSRLLYCRTRGTSSMS